ncbi:hypothetical protein P3H78_33120, partial [Streptomyces sp. K1PA1]|nr:hypothetical protein [Streptomyces tropicalis]
GASATAAVIATGRITLDSDLQRAGYTTERLGERRVVVRRPQGAVPVGPDSPAHRTRPDAVRLAAVNAALRPLHAHLTDLLSAIHDAQPGLAEIDDLEALSAELAALDEDFPLASNPPGLLDQSARRQALQRTGVYGLLDQLKREASPRNEALDRALVDVHGQHADRYVHALAGTLQHLLHEYASGRNDFTRTRLTSPYPTLAEEQRAALAREAAVAPAAAVESAPTVQDTTPSAEPSPAADEAARDADPEPVDGQQGAVPPAAGGGAGRDNPPPPAPGGNDEPDQPDEQAAPQPAPVSAGSAPAFTRLRQIRAPRRALNEAVRTLAATDHFTQRAAQDGPETALREALATFTRVSLNQPLDFHTAVEALHAAATLVDDTWRNTDVPGEAAQALAKLVQAAEAFTGSWRATVTSPDWDTLFKGAPRPSLPQPAATAAPAALEINDAAMPGITLAEQHAALRTVINAYG